jgi:Zn-dependent protease with chaperone function
MYKPTIFNKQHNVTPEKPVPNVIKMFFILLVAVVVIYWGLTAGLDYFVSHHVSIEQEKWLWREFRKAPDMNVVTGKKAHYQKHAAQLLANLLKYSLPKPYDYKIMVIDDKAFNAYAMPGGTIILTSTAYETFQGNDEALSFVIGHELGHFQNRDQLKGLGNKMILFFIIRPLLGQDLAGAFARFAMLFENQYGHKKEELADHWGMRLLLDQYGRPNGAFDVFNFLESNSQKGRFKAFFQMHPAYKERKKSLVTWLSRIQKKSHNAL